jgi:LAGLIDADG-like domain
MSKTVLHKKYNLDVFPQNNSISYYLLGAFITDGTVHRRGSVAFSSKDEIWAKEIAKNISCDIKVSSFKTHINTNHHYLSFCNKTITDWLIANECVPNKSLIVKMPNVPDEHFGSFLRGCMDGDGCISFKDKKCRKDGKPKRKSIITYICGSSYDFLKSAQEKLKALNIKGNLRNQNLKPQMMVMGKLCNTHPHYRLTITGRQALKFLELIYQDNVLCPDRKFAIYKEAKEYFDLNPISNKSDKK